VPANELAEARDSLASVLYLNDLWRPLERGRSKRRPPELWVLWGLLLPFGLFIDQRGRQQEGGPGATHDGLTLVDTWSDDPALDVRLYEVDASAFPPREVSSCWDRAKVASRGACLQTAWLDGGEDGVRTSLEALPRGLPLARIWQPCW